MMISAHKTPSFPSDPQLVRNICFMAHVDHGKTTMVDHLIASNKIIPENMAGKFKYMDSREDEQKHGITMKSSSIMLNYNKDRRDYVINVIDSPGHVDFSSEVSCAVRICDGTIILIDVVEGVCPQTEVVLRQSWREGIKPCLAINKIDRLMHEIMMKPLDAYIHILKIIDETNAIMAALFKETELEYEEFNHNDQIYFSPLKGNVIFCSSNGGWGFRIDDFVRYFEKKLNIKNNKYFKIGFWGDYYYDFKLKKILPEAQDSNKKPIFVQFILENIWAVYDAFLGVNANTESQIKIVKKINENLLNKVDKISKVEDKYIVLMKNWLPLADSLMQMIVDKLPCPFNLSSSRIINLLSSSLIKFNNLPDPSKQLKTVFFNCSSSNESPIIVYVSKMMYYAERDLKRSKTQSKFIAFCRIFSGTIKSGANLYALTPKYIPGDHQEKKYHQNFIVQDLYIMMGKDLINVDHVPAGNIFGMNGLDEIIYKSGTISSTLDCPAFSSITFEVNPILNVAVEPQILSDYDTLVESLRILNLSDPILKYKQCTESGEHILSVVGEVHLRKCIEDLHQLLENIPLTISEPIIPFRETISNSTNFYTNYPPFIKNFTQPMDYHVSYSNDKLIISTLDQKICLKLRVENLTPDLTEFLEQNNNLIKFINERRNKEIPESFLSQLKSLLNAQMQFKIINVLECIMCFSTGLSTNILIDNFSDVGRVHKNIFSNLLSSEHDDNLDISLRTGMQLACGSGPIFSEIITGVCFIIEDISFSTNECKSEYICDLTTSGQLVSLMKQSCLSCLVLSNKLRCCIPMYKCIVRSNVKILSGVYSVLNKRLAKIVQETQIEGTSVFIVDCLIPAPEIFGLSEEMRSKTSGSAQIQLTFNHWEIIPIDPFYQKYQTDIKTTISPKTLQSYIYSIRKRKGLKVDDKLIEESEKQRTIKRNK
ncbi:hypothetical protein HZS_6835 [Henneguya salminicola]|nr:hypothetical protein HZS_6835 [Henneguya salminicola]